MQCVSLYETPFCFQTIYAGQAIVKRFIGRGLTVEKPAHGCLGGFLDGEGKRPLAAFFADLGGFDFSLSFLPDRAGALAFVALRRASWPGWLDLLAGALGASSALCIFSSLQNPSFQLKREVLGKGLNCSAARAMSRYSPRAGSAFDRSRMKDVYKRQLYLYP